MATEVRKRRVGTDLTQGKIAVSFIKFAIPLLLANLVQQLYNTVDLIVIGHFAGSEGTVGTSTGGDYSNLITMISMGFSMAAQVYIGQLAGAKDFSKLRQTIGTLFTLMLGCSTVFAIVGVIFAKWFLVMLNTPQEAFKQAYDYMIVTSIGMPFVFGYSAVCGVMRGMGESKRPLYFVLISAVANIFLDLLFVAVFKLAAFGTALATVIAQAVSFACQPLLQAS